MKNTILLLTVLISFISFTYAQYPQWQNFTTANSGLPDNQINTIAIDESDKKWIGTEGGGLAKFNGTNWTIYNDSNSDLPEYAITTIDIYENGPTWIGTEGGGLAKFDGLNWTMFNTSNSGLPSNEIKKLAIDQNGVLWVGTNGDGLAKIDGVIWTNYNTSNSGLPDNTVSSVAIDQDGEMWTGGIHYKKDEGSPMGSGIAMFDGTIWTNYNTSNSALPFNPVTALTIDPDGTKWIGTIYNDGWWNVGSMLSSFDGTKWTNHWNNLLQWVSISSIAIDNTGIKWIGTDGNGLIKFDGINWTTFNTTNSGLPGNHVSSVAIDKYERIWIGTSEGLAVFNENSIPVSVEEKIITENNVKIYPNPVDDYLNIELQSGISISFLEIRNMQGILIKSQQFTNNRNTLDVQDLPVGIYIIRMFTDKGSVTKKLIKQ